MLFRFCLVLSLLMIVGVVDSPVRAEDGSAAISVTDKDWAWWRGPNRNGVAVPGQSLPAEWDDEQNVAWIAAVPGRGHGAPTVVGDRIFLATADEENQTQSVICMDRATGDEIWTTVVHDGGLLASGTRQGHARSTKASSTVASDGHRVFINFFNRDAVYTTALDFDGEQIWQHKVTNYVMHQGYGSSPTIYGPLVIVSADNKGGGAIAAFDRVTGEVAWRRARPELPNYASPVVLEIDGKDQLIFTGCDVVASFDPMTGETNWEAPGATTECVTTTITDGTHVVTSGGYPDKHISVMRGDGSGEQIWRNGTQVYVPSLLLHEGYLYAVTDSGAALCHELKTGELMWEERLRAKFAASPILVGDMIYATGSRGNTFVFKANPEKFELVAENKISADEVEATAAICDGRIYLRVAQKVDGRRQEMLYCIGTGQ